MSSFLFLPESPVPVRIDRWSTESRTVGDNNSSSAASGDSYSGLYGEAGGGTSSGLLSTVQIGGGAALCLEYEGLTCSDVNALYTFWQQVLSREQARDRSAFRISPVHCLWGLTCFPRAYQIINQLWAFSQKQLEFSYQGVGECGTLMKCQIELVSIPEVLSYE